LQRRERGDGDVLGIHLEEVAQRRAGIAPTVAVGPQRDVPTRHIGTNKIGDRADVVARRDDRPLVALQGFPDPALVFAAEAARVSLRPKPSVPSATSLRGT